MGIKEEIELNVKEIIKLAATYLQLDEVLQMSILDGEEETVSDQTLKNYELLLRAVNLVYEEIACDYIPLKHREQVVCVTENILLSSLSKKPIHIDSVFNEKGEKVKFQLYPEHIKLENGTYFIEYSYTPDAVTLSDSLESFSNKITERVVSYAVASEYALISGLFDEATTWKKRFEDAIAAALSKKNAVKLPNRGWF